MFDGLKEKLGRFKDDVEETADEKAEPVEDEAPEGEEEAEDDGEAASEADAPDPDADATDATDAAAAATESEDADATSEESDSDADEPAEDAAADADAATEGDDADSDGDDADSDDADSDGDDADSDDADSDGDDADADEDASTGFARKAKNLAKGKFVIEEEDLEDPLWDLEMALIESDVEMGVAEELLENIRGELVGQTRTFTTGTGQVVEDALRDALLEVISVGQFDFEERLEELDEPIVIVFTGVNGVGKTTTIAKLARYLEDWGHSSVLANGDTFRAGANEQIEEHADNLGKKCIAHEQGGDPAAVIYDAVEYAEANDVDVVLGDTAGRLHTSEGLMDQLAKIDRVVDPDMTIFVDEAVAGQDAVNRAREFNDAAAFDGAVLTKADADAQGGAAISVAHVTGKPILFLGTGQGYEDLERFDPEWLVDQLLGEE